MSVSTQREVGTKGRVSSAQLGLLASIAKAGEFGPDADVAAGCHGAALDRVLDALYRKGFVELKVSDNKAVSWTAITDLGRTVLSRATATSEVER